MLHNKNKPCNECPFLKKAAPGWLGPDSALEVWQQVHSEHGYPCHMDVTEKSDNPDDDEGPPAEIVEQCAGALMFASKTAKCYRDPELARHQKELKGCKTEVLGHEFLEHHKMPKRETK